MKLLFFSDVHGSPESLALLLRQAERLKPELLVLLGDVLYHGPRNPLKKDYAPQRVVEMLNPYRERIAAVRGNCDSEVDQMLLEFPVMADYSTLFADGRRFFLTHGHLWNPEKLPPIPMDSVFVFGHIHVPVLRKEESGLAVLNPGSISLPKGGNPPSFAFYENQTLRILNLENGEEMARLSL